MAMDLWKNNNGAMTQEPSWVKMAFFKYQSQSQWFVIIFPVFLLASNWTIGLHIPSIFCYIPHESSVNIHKNTAVG